jgi:hypothetical protein
MSYEAQIAGVADHDPKENFVVAMIQRILKKISLSDIRKKRALFAEVIKDFISLDQSEGPIYNGGGSGSVCSTPKDLLVNEITIGSGILAPGLFQHYEDLDIKAAMFFSLPVVRKPNDRVVCLYSGGYMASGALSPSKQPRLFWPQGFSLRSSEGLGEVQSPVLAEHCVDSVDLGDPFFFYPAKSGEIMERFSHIELFSADKSLKSILTYRGEGFHFG